MKKLIVSVFVIGMLFSCNKKTANQEIKSNTENISKKVEQTIFDLNKLDKIVGFTAYKTTEKIGVKGVFNNIELTNVVPVKDFTKVLDNVSFSIPVKSLETMDSGRNQKIIDLFFGKMMGSEKITGTFDSYSKGNITVKLKMNDVEKIVDLKMEVSKEIIELSGTIDVLDFGASAPLKALNEACYDLHKGADGISKTWSEVTLNIKVKK